ncbi:hypothetical protein ACH5RR_017899 [Cinchona calisaya]|uniref:Uncharacterized protein n=1 Tax=Cinchona calisaya TaxID=153742 RepID=A0ABD2ZNI9_9GENT
MPSTTMLGEFPMVIEGAENKEQVSPKDGEVSPTNVIANRSHDDISYEELENKSNSENKDNNPTDDPSCSGHKRKHCNRHTPYQINELEAFFKECSYPNVKQRKEISRHLGLEPLQVKFWFQNKRVHMRTHLEHVDNARLKEENEQLHATNIKLREAFTKGYCFTCGNPQGTTNRFLNENQLRMENSRLKNKIARMTSLVANYVGKPYANKTFPSSSIIPSNYVNLDTVALRKGQQEITDFEKSTAIEISISAMEELIRMVEIESPLWISTMDDRKNFLNEDAYYNMFSKAIELKPAGFNIEASKETVVVLMNHLNLVEVFMDMDKWLSIFANIISRGLVLEVISTGSEHGNFDGTLQMITWVEHVIVQDEGDNYLGKPFVELSLAFGAQRWLSILARQCERLTGEMMINFSLDDIDTVLITPEGRKNILKLSEKMVIGFCGGVTSSTAQAWLKQSKNAIGQIRIMTKKKLNDLIKPFGVVLSVTTSFWLPVTHKLVFDFLRDVNNLAKWDALFNFGDIQEMFHISNVNKVGNFVSLSRVANSSQGNMLILQECCTHPTGSYIVYAPVDELTINLLLAGGNPDHVAILPSGFTIYPCGPIPAFHDTTAQKVARNVGSLVTVAFQILVDYVPTTKISVSSISIINNLIKCTSQKMIAALSTLCNP